MSHIETAHKCHTSAARNSQSSQTAEVAPAVLPPIPSTKDPEIGTAPAVLSEKDSPQAGLDNEMRNLLGHSIDADPKTIDLKTARNADGSITLKYAVTPGDKTPGIQYVEITDGKPTSWVTKQDTHRFNTANLVGVEAPKYSFNRASETSETGAKVDRYELTIPASARGAFRLTDGENSYYLNTLNPPPTVVPIPRVDNAKTSPTAQPVDETRAAPKPEVPLAKPEVPLAAIPMPVDSKPIEVIERVATRPPISNPLVEKHTSNPSIPDSAREALAHSGEKTQERDILPPVIVKPVTVPELPARQSALVPLPSPAKAHPSTGAMVGPANQTSAIQPRVNGNALTPISAQKGPVAINLLVLPAAPARPALGPAPAPGQAMVPWSGPTAIEPLKGAIVESSHQSAPKVQILEIKTNVPQVTPVKASTLELQAAPKVLPEVLRADALRGLRAFSSNPGVQNTGAIVFLAGLHNAYAGKYQPDDPHSPLPKTLKLLAGSQFDDQLKDLGLGLTWKTSEAGQTLCWAMDTASSAGDAGIVIGGAKACEIGIKRLAVPALEALTRNRASFGWLAGAPKIALKVAGASYSIVNGYSNGRSQETLTGSNRDANISGVGTIVEGFAAGCFFGGPVGGVLGATAGAGAHFWGAVNAIDDSVAESKLKTIQRGVRETIERGFIMPTDRPDNPITPEAAQYLDQFAKANIMSQLIELKEKGGLGKLDLEANNWQKNWNNIDTILNEVHDYLNPNDKRSTYIFSNPLGRFNEHEKNALAGAYQNSYLKFRSDVTQHYCRSFLVSNSDTSTATTWQRLKGTEAASKIERTDAMLTVATEFEKQFAERESKLTEQKLSIDEQKKLLVEETEYLRKNVPDFFDIITDEKRIDSMRRATAVDNSRWPVMDSLAVRAARQAPAELARVNETAMALESQEIQTFLKEKLSDPDFRDFVFKHTAKEAHAPLSKLWNSQRLTDSEQKIVAAALSQTFKNARTAPALK